MPAFAANLNFLFTEYPFMERFFAARRAGFSRVEFMFPYDFDQTAVKRQLEENNLELVLCNLPAGNWAAGDRGLAADPARRDEFRSAVEAAVQAALFLGVPRLNCLVGKAPPDQSEAELWANLLEHTGYAAAEFAKHNLQLLVEPINRYDMPGFYLNTTSQVISLIEALNQDNVYLQYDLYHADREGEDLPAILQKNFPRIGHIQIADNPGRNQPGTGAIDFTTFFKTIGELDYKGYISMEYKPDPDTETSLGWLSSFGLTLT